MGVSVESLSIFWDPCKWRWCRFLPPTHCNYNLKKNPVALWFLINIKNCIDSVGKSPKLSHLNKLKKIKKWLDGVYESVVPIFSEQNAQKSPIFVRQQLLASLVFKLKKSLKLFKLYARAKIWKCKNFESLRFLKFSEL